MKPLASHRDNKRVTGICDMRVTETMVLKPMCTCNRCKRLKSVKPSRARKAKRLGNKRARAYLKQQTRKELQ